MPEPSSPSPPLTPPVDLGRDTGSKSAEVEGKAHRVLPKGGVGIALITAILAVSTSSVFIRFAQADAPSLVIAALRLTFATLMLAPIALTRHRDELRNSNTPGFNPRTRLRIIPGRSFWYVDFIAGVHDGRKLGRVCIDRSALGGIALTFPAG